MEAKFKLKPSKCHFARDEVEYLGYLVTPAGLKPTTLHVKTVEKFPKMSRGNNNVVVFQNFLSKFSLVFQVPDQKMDWLAQLLVEQVVPLFGVPKALLSD